MLNTVDLAQCIEFLHPRWQSRNLAVGSRLCSSATGKAANCLTMNNVRCAQIVLRKLRLIGALITDSLLLVAGDSAG